MFMASRSPKGAAVDDWIIIPNWERFQHYKDRNPTWIKLYTELESDPDWDNLTLPQRGLLVTVWLMYARSRGQCTRKAVAKQVGRSYKAHSLEVLNHAGFIQFSASRPLALCYPRGRERVREEPSVQQLARPPENGRTDEQVFDYKNILQDMPL